jgi:hypothetical protein
MEENCIGNHSPKRKEEEDKSVLPTINDERSDEASFNF